MKKSIKHVLPILATLHAVNRKYGKLYCFPAQFKIIELLGLYQNLEVSIATLNRWLKDSEEKKYIMRIRRIKKDRKKGIMFKSTLYKITIKGYHALGRAGVAVYRDIKRVMAEGLKAGQESLKRKKGFVSIGTILDGTMIFGGRKAKLIVE